MRPNKVEIRSGGDKITGQEKTLAISVLLSTWKTSDEFVLTELLIIEG